MQQVPGHLCRLNSGLFSSTAKCKKESQWLQTAAVETFLAFDPELQGSFKRRAVSLSETTPQIFYFTADRDDGFEMGFQGSYPGSLMRPQFADFKVSRNSVFRKVADSHSLTTAYKL